MSETKLTIIIQLEETSSSIKRTLSSLDKLNQMCEVIFISDFKKYRETALIESFVSKHENSLFIKSEAFNRGIANTYNEAVTYAKGEYLLFVSPGSTIDLTSVLKEVDDLHHQHLVLGMLKVKGGSSNTYNQSLNKIDHSFKLVNDELSFIVKKEYLPPFLVQKSFLLEDNTRVDFYHQLFFTIYDAHADKVKVLESTYTLEKNYTLKKKYIQNKINLIKFIRKLKRFIRFRILHFISILYSLVLPVDDHKVVFISDVRKEMGGNLKNVYDYLTQLGYNTQIEFKWDRRARRTLRQKFSLVKNLSTAKYIYLEDMSNSITHTHFRKSQEIIQLWHGPGAYKKFGYSRVKTGEYEKSKIHKGYKKYTKVSVSADYIRWCYAEAFDISVNNVKALGFPRTDDFYNEDYIKSVKNEFYKNYPELKDKKIILFAPTYRGKELTDYSYDFSALDMESIYSKYKDEYVFIIKWHFLLYNNIKLGIVKQPDYSKYKGFVYDLSDYRDINELLVVCDTLITDYSSLIFDYVLLNKPIIYYAYDLNDYTGEGSRGLYFDFDEYVYGCVAKNTEELIEAIDHNDLEKEKRTVFFNKFMGACDGYSTEKICESIMGISYKKDKKLIHFL